MSNQKNWRPRRLVAGFLIIAIVLFGYFAYAKFNQPEETRKVLYYRGTMHPDVRSDKPGKCPICGMDLVPVYEEERKEEAAEMRMEQEVKLSANQLKHLNVQTAVAKVASLKKEIRAAGEVAYDPKLLVAEEEYLSAVESGLLVESSRRKLQVLGLSEQEINDLTQADQSLILPAKEMWVYADIYEQELSFVKIGQPVKISSIGFPGQEFKAQVVSIEPILESRTRSATARIKVANPALLLQPKMFVDVYISASQRPALIIPKSAVLDTGERQIAYVEKSAGVFEPRDLNVGLAGKDDVIVLHGLSAGEIVVTSANFLIDSETQLTGGSSSLYGGAKEVKSNGHNH